MVGKGGTGGQGGNTKTRALLACDEFRVANVFSILLVQGSVVPNGAGRVHVNNVVVGSSAVVGVGLFFHHRVPQ